MSIKIGRVIPPIVSRMRVSRYVRQALGGALFRLEIVTALICYPAGLLYRSFWLL